MNKYYIVPNFILLKYKSSEIYDDGSGSDYFTKLNGISFIRASEPVRKVIETSGAIIRTSVVKKNTHELDSDEAALLLYEI